MPCRTLAGMFGKVIGATPRLDAGDGCGKFKPVAAVVGGYVRDTKGGFCFEPRPEEINKPLFLLYLWLAFRLT